MMGTDDLENMVMELATDLEPGSWTRSDDLSSEEKIQRSADIMKNTPEMYHRYINLRKFLKEIKREETERTCSSISRH
ncbi:Hypothetical predicted protein [Cloeon dipterum]|uniref:Uncharacterized protein n=1 Tax=Cloeon dipterum TaxID=197152 RepID=A0A8S1BNA2_9INSE|nr:Hypothetical predicted protein [Cloeon dipterum]